MVLWGRSVGGLIFFPVGTLIKRAAVHEMQIFCIHFIFIVPIISMHMVNDTDLQALCRQKFKGLISRRFRSFNGAVPHPRPPTQTF
jgi:hypothetical protein